MWFVRWKLHRSEKITGTKKFMTHSQTCSCANRSLKFSEIPLWRFIGNSSAFSHSKIISLVEYCQNSYNF